MGGKETLCDARHLTPEDERKIAAYDAARATVKIEGNTRAYYVLRAEAAEAALQRVAIWYETATGYDAANVIKEALRG